MMAASSILFIGILLVFSFGIQESFAEIGELVTVSNNTEIDIPRQQQSPTPDNQPPPSNIDSNLEIVDINPAVLDDEMMNITIFGEVLQVTHEKTITRADDDFTYVGSTNGSAYSVWIAYYQGDMRIEIDLPRNNYILEPFVDKHIFTKYSETSFGAANEGGSGIVLNPDYQSIVDNVPMGTFTSNNYKDITIDIIYLYTNKASDIKGQNNIRMMGNLGIDKINNSFDHSRIPVQLKNVEIGSVGSTYVDSGNMVTEINRLIDLNDGYMNRATALRDGKNADIGFLFTADGRVDFCGKVSELLASDDTAFLAINVNCSHAQIATVIAHEFGHLAGAQHDFTTNGGYEQNPFHDGHGYRVDSENLSTIMAYPCESCEWQNVWSNPNRPFERSIVVAGNVARENNALVLTKVAPHLASLRGDPQTYVLSTPLTRTPLSIESIPDMSFHHQVTKRIDVTATSPENNPITLTLVTGPTFASFSDNGNGRGVITLDPSVDDVGSHLLTVRATSGGLTGSEPFIVTVTTGGGATANVAPKVTLSRVTSGQSSGATISLTASATDANNDSLVYSWVQKTTNAPEVEITNPDRADASFVIPHGRTASTVIFIFEVTVSDGKATTIRNVSFSADITKPVIPVPPVRVVDPKIIETVLFDEQFANFSEWDESDEWDIDDPVDSLSANSNNKVAHIEDCDDTCYLEMDDSDPIVLRGFDSAILSFWIWYDDDTRGNLDADDSLETEGTMVQAYRENSWQDLGMISLQSMPEERWFQQTVSLNRLINGEVLVRFSPMLYGDDNTIQIDAVQIIGQKRDKQGPVFSNVNNVQTSSMSEGGAFVTYTVPTATDNVDGVVNVSCDEPNGVVFPVGTTTVTCTATDRSGNISMTTLDIVVTLLVVPVCSDNQRYDSATNTCIGIPPSQITDLSYLLNSSNDQITFTWSAPSDNGYPLLGYKLEQILPGATAWSVINASYSATQTSYVHNVVQGLEYSFRVSSENANGFGLVSNTVNFVVPDITAPTLILRGGSVVEIDHNTVFVEPGFSANDNVDGVLDGMVVVTGTVDHTTVDSYVILYRVSDAAGNMFTVQRTVRVVDSIAPQVTAPTDKTFEATSMLTPLDIFQIGTATATDNVDSNPVIGNDAPETFPLGDTTVTWSATDRAGNKSTAVQVVTIQDTTPPSITAPSDVTLEATGLLTMLQLGTAVATDLVDSSPTVTSDAPTSFSVGTHVITYTATDDSGNFATDTQNITIADTTDPMLVLPSDITAEATGSFTSLDIGTATVTDNVDDITATNDAPVSFPLGDTIVTWSATDGAGNIATDTQTITIQDTTPPTFLEYSDVILSTGNAAETVTFDTPQATDIFDVTVSCDHSSGDSFDVGTTAVTCTATDTSENSSMFSFNVMLNFILNSPPNIESIPDVSFGHEMIKRINVVATDSEDDPIVLALVDSPSFASISDDGGGLGVVTLDPSVGDVGPHTVTVQATSSDVSVKKSFGVRVTADDGVNPNPPLSPDTTPPIITAPLDITAPPTSFLTDVDIGNATATDNVDSSPAITNNSTGSFPLGTTTVVWTATDTAGNTATDTQTVTISFTDTVFIIAPPDILHEATIIASDVKYIELGMPTVSDSVDVVSITYDSPRAVMRGDTTVTWIAVDAAGNRSTSTQIITVQDTKPPRFVDVHDGITSEATGILTPFVVTPPYVSDTTDRNPTITNNSTGFFPFGTTTIAWTATDDLGHTATDTTQTVTFIDTTPPSVTLNSAKLLAVLQQDAVIVTDLVDLSPAITGDTPTSFSIEDRIITYNVTDDRGNSASQSFKVTIKLESVIQDDIIFNDMFDTTLDSWRYKDVPNTNFGCDVGPSTYNLSHSPQRDGSAYLNSTDGCWVGHTGAEKTFSIPDSFSGSKLQIDVDYRSLADQRYFRSVNNAYLTVTDSNNVVLKHDRMFRNFNHFLGTVDSGWQHYTSSIDSVRADSCPCNIFIHTRDASVKNYHQQLHLDNIRLKLISQASGSAGETQQIRNSLTQDELFDMQFNNGTVINTKLVHDNSIVLKWDSYVNATQYKVVIAPSDTPRQKFADTTSDNQYRFVNLEPDTAYDVSVGVRGDDATQSMLHIKTLPSGQFSFTSNLNLEFDVDDSLVTLSWHDDNDTGENRYRVERSVDGGQFIETDHRPKNNTSTSDIIQPIWAGKDVEYRVFEWLGDQKLHSNVVSISVPEN